MLSSPSSSPAATTAHPPPSPETSQIPSNILSSPQITRRYLFKTLSLCLAAAPSPLSASTVAPANARGLFQMPPLRLSNRYYLVRAGESDYESLGIINTNPVAKTSVDSGLSEKGKKQTVRAALQLKALGACDRNCWLWPSITQRAYQAAEIIASINGISRSYIVPEYSFLDARGLGAYEGKKLDSISEVYALDSISMKTKPPPISDGTPNESVSDVFVRVTQLMSILETQYSEDTIVIVSPDSDNLSVLQAGVQGLDLRRHSELYFGPGEVRLLDANSIPVYKQPASAVYKCTNPPNCD
uniref:Phosphoglycerate mutase family protein n=1 Tax=Noccaea caerulescens TaxID=107243 RepID=A0A1J3EWG8_NOCCA